MRKNELHSVTHIRVTRNTCLRKDAHKDSYKNVLRAEYIDTRRTHKVNTTCVHSYYRLRSFEQPSDGRHGDLTFSVLGEFSCNKVFMLCFCSLRIVNGCEKAKKNISKWKLHSIKVSGYLLMKNSVITSLIKGIVKIWQSGLCMKNFGCWVHTQSVFNYCRILSPQLSYNVSVRFWPR